MSTPCAEFCELLSAMLDGELPEADRARVEAHAGACPECRRMLERFRRLDAALADAPEPPAVPAGRWGRMLGEIKRAGRVREAAVLRPAPARPLRLAAFALAAAAALVLAVALFSMQDDRGDRHGRGAHQTPEYCSAEVVALEPSGGESQTLVLAAPEGGLSLVIVSSAVGTDASEARGGG